MVELDREVDCDAVQVTDKDVENEREMELEEVGQVVGVEDELPFRLELVDLLGWRVVVCPLVTLWLLDIEYEAVVVPDVDAEGVGVLVVVRE